ncbi:MAG: bifunctional phosphoribosylaminoimidazolecarboxamide formyltransferase/IMP cyclohydrolase [Ignavibacteriaceae bacterium]|nr:bifunctional phosphoribosylaminoimidazolecarboxamide formyltransferase/IMP cyclohydrolase [Ignavibacteriaceae bacterium]
MKKLALISVFDKTGIVEFANGLKDCGFDIIATGNSFRLLTESRIQVTEIKDLTGFPEIFHGRVKTLHPKISGGILMRVDNQSDLKEAEENGISPIEVVCVNLYPFKDVAKNPDADLDTLIENIDIGGPTMIRAAAKNNKFVSVITNPQQYEPFLNELKAGSISYETKKKLAIAAFTHTADYDSYIVNTLQQKMNVSSNYFNRSFKLASSLRYGENPHQQAGVYGEFYDNFEFIHGKELSYNNILDLVSAVELAESLGKNSCTIIKHNNPAGASIGVDSFDAYTKALRCDPVSSFGGIVAFTSTVDEKLAEKLNEIFLEVVCAPEYTDGAISILKKKKDRRLLKQKKSILREKVTFRSIPGGAIVQDADLMDMDELKIKTVTEKKPSAEELEDLKFAWKIAKYTKSNAIVFVKDKATLGVGAGQMSRIDSAKIAKMKAEEHGLDLNGSVAASDAFFPFADGLIEIVNCGAVSVIQPGGSVRDQEVIDAANQRNISMVFTGIRHFKH